MKFKRWLVVLCVVSLLGMALAITGSAQARAGGTLVMALGEEPDTLDPNVTNRFHSLTALSYIVEPLFVLDENFAAVPLLIDGFDWTEDKLTMTVYLTHGITFHNGQEMTSRDVKASYERYFELSPMASYLPPEKGGITTIETPDDYTIIFRFERAKPLALFYMADAHISIMPADWLAATSDEEIGVKALVGTGPFMLDEWVRGDRIVMKRFEDYAHGPAFSSNKGPAYLEELVMRIVPEDATMVAEIMAGSVDLTFDVPLSSSKQLEALANVEVLSAPTFSIQYFVCNTEKEIFIDKRVRMAIAHAINREEIAKAAWFGIGAPLYGIVGPATTGYWQGMPYVAYSNDLEKANAYLDAAGWVDSNGNGVRDKAGEEMELTLITFSNIDMWKRAAEIVQQQLAKVGIRVNLELAEVGATYDRAESGNYDLGIFRNTWWMGVPYMTFLTHGDNTHSSNFGQIQNDILDTLLLLSGEELNDNLRKEAFYVAQALVVESAVWVPLIANVNIAAAQTSVGGLDELYAHPWQPPLLRALLLYKE